jgi:hypothetical protein
LDVRCIFEKASIYSFSMVATAMTAENGIELRSEIAEMRGKNPFQM